jgi:hypothetical protein
MKETLKAMKDTLIAQTHAQMANLHAANCEELGEAIDMIKDIEETLYYCAIVDAMEEKKDEEGKNETRNTYYYTERYMPAPIYYDRDIDRYSDGRMYYSGNNSSSNMPNGSNMS